MFDAMRGGSDVGDGRLGGGSDHHRCGDGRAARPVALEVTADFFDHRPDGDDVQVDERYILAGSEVLIADIATADDGGLAIGRERLVVHAAIRAREVDDIVE